MAEKIKTWSPIAWIQRILGLGIGIFFGKPFIQAIQTALSESGGTIQIPSIIGWIAGFTGTVGIIILLLVIIGGMRLLSSLAMLVTWICIGAILTIFITHTGLNIPDFTHFVGWVKEWWPFR